MALTVSEQFFERFCSEHGLVPTRVPVASGRTPDYDLPVAGRTVVVEVKQVEPTVQDARELERFRAGGVATLGGEAGKRVRQEITDSKAQIRSRAKGKHPALLVLYNNAEPISYLDPMFILLAMYGQLVATIRIPSTEGQSFIERLSFGGKRMVTEQHNTTISAVCVLIADPSGAPTLTFYHNSFAALPFEPDWLRGPRAKHYHLPHVSSGTFGFWEPF